MLKRTPLYSVHQKLGAHLVEFGGWEMPLCYTSILEEHRAVRSTAGIFDISHMGEVSVRGAGALDFLNSVLTNDARKLQPGQGQYTLLCNPRGGAIDDLYLYQLGAGDYLLVVNASRLQADVAWLESQWAGFAGRRAVALQNRSEELAAVAVQGPRAHSFIDSCFPAASPTASALRKNEITRLSFAGQSVLLSRTGYTGEDGFEAVAPAETIETLWNTLLEAGRPFGLKPAGLGARDTLRTEACYPLYGHELDEETTPLEAGLGFFVALGKGDFVGRAVLAEQKARGPAKKLAAFKMAGRSAPPRPQYPIWSASGGTAPIGRVTSGTQSPSLGLGIGMGYVAPAFSPANTAIAIEIRSQRVPAVIVSRPIYRPARAGASG
ncbi:MAG: glycine cleavage system aminomethyltransferase GcvT [Verrucomicrobiota bacterium]|jgi:aminomethyltransferase